MHRCEFEPATPTAIVKAAVARSNVTVYAVVDACASCDNDGNLAEKSWGVESDQESGSRIGFKDRAELNSGISVSYGLKKGIDRDTGAFTRSHSTTSRLYGRQTWGGPGACYLYRPMNVQFAYHKENTRTGPTALSGVPGEECAVVVSTSYNFGVGNVHVVYTDKKLQTINGDGKDRNDLVGVSTPAGTADKALAVETRNQVRDMSSEHVDQCAFAYAYLLPVCTNLYTSYSYPRNEDSVALATYNNNVHAANVKRLNVGMHHKF